MAAPSSPSVPQRTAPRAGGYSLIEVLVSIFIVSMGILALAGLLTTASRYGKTSEIRSVATLLANDLADHVRANANGAAGGGYDLAGRFPASLPPPPHPAACTASAPCLPGQLAAVDLATWRARVRSELPSGSGYVRFNAPSGAAPGSVDLWVAWSDPVPGPERNAAECPAGLEVAGDAAVRCTHLQVGLR